MKAYGKSWGYNVYDCRYCLYRKGKLKGCVYPDGCCCPVPQKPARRNGIEQVYEAAADNAAPVSECEGCPYHDLRHSCASLLLANGVPMKQIQEWLGHSDFSTTANIYAHLEYSSKVISADAMLAGLGIGNRE